MIWFKYLVLFVKGESEAQEIQSREEEVKAASTRTIKTKLILIMVWRKLIRNPNTYACLFGLMWSAISFR